MLISPFVLPSEENASPWQIRAISELLPGCLERKEGLREDAINISYGFSPTEFCAGLDHPKWQLLPLHTQAPRFRNG